MHEDFCGGESNPGLCDEMDPYDGELLRQYLLNVKFTGTRASHILNTTNLAKHCLLTRYSENQRQSSKFSWRDNYRTLIVDQQNRICSSHCVCVPRSVRNPVQLPAQRGPSGALPHPQLPPADPGPLRVGHCRQLLQQGTHRESSSFSKANETDSSRCQRCEQLPRLRSENRPRTLHAHSNRRVIPC